MNRTGKGVLAVVIVVAVGAPIVLLRGDTIVPSLAESEPAASAPRMDVANSVREPIPVSLPAVEADRDDSPTPQGTESAPEPHERTVADAHEAALESPSPPFLQRDRVGEETLPPDTDRFQATNEKNDDASEHGEKKEFVLKSAWRRVADPGLYYLAVAADSRIGDLYVSVSDEETSKNTILVLGPSGEAKREFSVAEPFFEFRCAAMRTETSHLNSVNALDLMGDVLDGDKLTAVSAIGEPLWSTPVEPSHRLQWVADLDGDGLDEFLISCAGSPAFKVYDHRGIPLWTTPTLGNAWSATAADVVGDDRPEVIVSSRASPGRSPGDVDLYDSTGNALATLEPVHCASILRTTRSAGQDNIVAVDSISYDDRVLVFAMTGTGERLWNLSFPVSGASDFEEEFEIDDTGQWGAIAMDESPTRLVVYVVDLKRGELEAGAPSRGPGARRSTWFGSP